MRRSEYDVWNAHYEHRSCAYLNRGSFHLDPHDFIPITTLCPLLLFTSCPQQFRNFLSNLLFIFSLYVYCFVCIIYDSITSSMFAFCRVLCGIVYTRDYHDSQLQSLRHERKWEKHLKTKPTVLEKLLL